MQKKSPQPRSVSLAYANGVKSLGQIFRQPRYLILAGGLYPLILWLFIYLTSLNLFTHIWRNEGLSSLEKWQFLLGSITNVFTHITDPLALSIVVFAAFATLNLVTLIYALRSRQQLSASGGSATVVALVGSHCLACGGSLLAPLITALSGSGAFISAARAETALLLALTINGVAILLIAHATLMLATRSVATPQAT